MQLKTIFRRMVLLGFVSGILLVLYVFFFVPAGPAIVVAESGDISLEYAPPAQVNVEDLPACRAGLDAARSFEEPPVAAQTEAPTADPNAPTATPQPPTPTPRPAPIEDRVGFPENYLEDFKLLFVFDRPDNQQVRAICGNDLASGTAEGEAFPYGSILVMETWATKRDENRIAVLDENGHYIRERLTGVFVQRKEEGFGEAYLEDRSGEWEYVAYRPNGETFIPPERTNPCATCHLTQGGEGLDFVFRMNLLHEGEEALSPPEVAENVVPIDIYAFHPRTLTVQAGTSVTWVNYDQAAHTVTSNEELFDSGSIASASVVDEPPSFAFTFDTPGIYEYTCEFHPAMTGVIEVVEASE